MSLTVGRVAKLSGLSVRSLHHYDEIGLLVPSQRSDTGYRLYSNEDVQRLYRIQALRQLGWSLSQVQGALDGGGTTIAGLLDRQITALDDRISHSTELRSRLVNLRDQLAQHQDLSPEAWLAAVELFGHYEKHLSAGELSRLSLLPDGDKDAWRSAYADAASAVARKIAPSDEEAQSLAHRWIALTWRQVGGDIQMAYKLKAAYKEDAGVRASMAAGAGVSPEVMQFIWAAIHHAHVAVFAKYFSADELARMSFTDEWGMERTRILEALGELMNREIPSDDAAVQCLIETWDAHIDRFVSSDAALRAKLTDVLHSDLKLRHVWLKNDDVYEFVRSAQRVRARDMIARQ